MLFFCGWQDGPVIDLPTCSFSGIECEGENILGPHDAKKLNVNFTEAVVTAGKTTGCCVCFASFFIVWITFTFLIVAFYLY
jgi:hypothetical protein